ncbi:hypothetical protein GGG16DRAFT_113923 [Schizophyllum commune]
MPTRSNVDPLPTALHRLIDIDPASYVSSYTVLFTSIYDFPYLLLVKVGAARCRSLQVSRLAQASIECGHPWMMAFGAVVRHKASIRELRDLSVKLSDAVERATWAQRVLCYATGEAMVRPGRTEGAESTSRAGKGVEKYLAGAPPLSRTRVPRLPGRRLWGNIESTKSSFRLLSTVYYSTWLQDNIIVQSISVAWSQGIWIGRMIRAYTEDVAGSHHGRARDAYCSGLISTGGVDLNPTVSTPQALFADDALGVLGPLCPLSVCIPREGASCAAACAGGRVRELWAFRDRGGGDAKRVKWWTAKGSNCSGRMEEGMLRLGCGRATGQGCERGAHEPGQRRVKARVQSGYALLRNSLHLRRPPLLLSTDSTAIRAQLTQWLASLLNQLVYALQTRSDATPYTL